MADARQVKTEGKPIQLTLIKNDKKTIHAVVDEKRCGIIPLHGPFTRQRLPKEHAKWIELRKGFMGGSDAGGVMNASQYSSPLTIYGDKLDLKPPENEGDKPWLRRGRVLEPVVMQEFLKDFRVKDGRAIRATKYPYFLQSTEHEFMSANIDGLVDVEGMGVGLLEIKTVNPFAKSAKEWNDGELPDAYYWQVLHYLIVTGLPYAIIAVWIDGRIEWRFIPRNELRIEELLTEEKYIWGMIKDKTPPAPVGLDNEDEIIRALDGDFGEVTIDLEKDYLALFDELEKTKAKLDKLKQREKAIKQRFRMALSGATKGKIGKHSVRVSTVHTRKFSATAFKAADPATYNKYIKPTSHERMTIK